MRRAIVAIGVNKTEGLPKLRAAADGARKVVEWATDQGFDSTLLTDELAPRVTLEMVTRSIHELVDKNIYDQLVVYFSGHGFLKGSNYEIWLLSGAPNNPNEAVNVTGSIDLSRNCGIPHVVFISDACRSIPNTIGMNYVLGGIIFPSQDVRPKRPEVDTFYATVPGNPALEVPPNIAGANYRGIFTDCLLKALWGQVGGIAQEVPDGAGGRIKVIPSRPLKKYLLKAVPDAASAVSIKLQQDPEIRVESDEEKYLAKIVDPPVQNDAEPEPDETPVPIPPIDAQPPDPATPDQPIEPSHPGPDDSGPSGILSNADVVDLFKKSHFLGQEGALPIELTDSPTATNISEEIQRILNTKGRESFETRTGFTVHGTKVISAKTTGNPCDVFEELSQSHIRVYIDPSLPHHFHKAPSTVIRFESGGGACLATLPGYVGTVVVEEERVVTVNYTPAKWTPEYPEYERVAIDLERRRAFAAVAARNGSFTMDRDEAGGAAQYLRMLKAFDPTLGIYAAYAYAQAGDQESIESVFSYMAEPKPGHYMPVPFDVAMLARRKNGTYFTFGFYDFAPNLPMLTQGWALLGGLEQLMPPTLLRVRNHLVPSLWTTFSKEGIDILEAAFDSGDFR